MFEIPGSYLQPILARFPMEIHPSSPPRYHPNYYPLPTPVISCSKI